MPIREDVRPTGGAAQHLLDRAAQSMASFEAENGEPVAYAMVLITADGTSEPFFQTCGFHGTDSPGRGGWRGFLALAGAMLVEAALQVDD